MLPIIYPLLLLYKKRDLNIWDFLLLFSCLFFSVIPAVYGHLLSFDTKDVKTVFFVVLVYNFTLLFVDLFFRKNHGQEFRVLNICLFLKHIKHFKISVLGKILIAIGIVVSTVYYLPRMSIAVRMEESGIRTSYAESSILMALTSVIFIIGVVLTLASLTNIKELKRDKFLIALDVFYLGLMIFMPRRLFVFALLEIAIVFYSLHRISISKKIVSYIIVIFFGLYLIYFPFYNVVRWNNVSFNPSHPIESLSAIIKYGIRNYSQQQTTASQSTDERSLGLYEALYNLFHNCTEWGNGKLTVAAIDGAIPRIINPNKGNGTERTLERMAGVYNDQADSILLEACGDFKFLGSLYAVILFAILFWLYEKYSYLYYKLFGSYLIPTFILFELLSITWNIEGNLGGRIAFFFSSIFSIIVLLILEHYKVISITRRRFIKITKVEKKTEEISEKKE